MKEESPWETSIERSARELRRSLPLLETSVSFNHAGVAPQPTSGSVRVFEELRAGALAARALASVKSVKEEIRHLYARLLRVSPAEIAVTRHTAEGVNLIAQGFPWKNRDRILTVDVEYPSNVYPWWNLRERGVEIVTVPERDGRVDLDEFFGALRKGVRMVAVSHVEFASGFAFDLRALSAACRAHGAFLFVDLAQSIGILPIDLTGVDAAAWPTWKWLMGPIGMGGFYLAERHLPVIRPMFVGTDSMVPAADYLDYRFEFRPDASRFEYSTENILGLIGTADALRRMEPLLGGGSAGKILRKVWELGDELDDHLKPRGYRLYSSRQDGERSGIFSFVTPEDPARIASRLQSRGIEAAVRARRLRLSPHFYNNSGDIDRLITALNDQAV